MTGGWLALVWVSLFLAGAFACIGGARTRLTVTSKGIETRTFERRRFVPLADISELVIASARWPRPRFHQIVAIHKDGSRVALDLSTVDTPTEGFERLNDLRREMSELLDLAKT
jgi:hypothetical protein